MATNPAIAPITAKHGASMAQIMIAWTLAQPGITFALCGARNPEQAIENARAGEIHLDADDLATLDAALATHLVAMDA